jgi:hypothetical protein
VGDAHRALATGPSLCLPRYDCSRRRRRLGAHPVMLAMQEVGAPIVPSCIKIAIGATLAAAGSDPSDPIRLRP